MLEKLSPAAGKIFREETYAAYELAGFADLAIRDLQDKLAKAQKTELVQSDIITTLRQLRIA